MQNATKPYANDTHQPTANTHTPCTLWTNRQTEVTGEAKEAGEGAEEAGAATDEHTCPAMEATVNLANIRSMTEAEDMNNSYASTGPTISHKVIYGNWQNDNRQQVNTANDKREQVNTFYIAELPNPSAHNQARWEVIKCGNICNVNTRYTPAYAQWAIHIMKCVSILLAIYLSIYITQTPMQNEKGDLGIHNTIELPNRRGGNNPPPPNYVHALGNNMPYMETQLNKFCQVHSINAYLGNQAINPMEVMQFAEHMHMNIIQKTGNPIGLSNHYNTGTCPGNFSTPIINYYLHQNQAMHGFLHTVTSPSYTPTYNRMHVALEAVQEVANCYENTEHGIQRGSTKQQIMRRINGMHSFILHYTTFPQAGNAYGHAVCVKKHNGSWYLLDSEKHHPVNLDTTHHGWEHLYGHVYALTPSQPNLTYFDPEGPQWRQENIDGGTIDMEEDTPPNAATNQTHTHPDIQHENTVLNGGHDMGRKTHPPTLPPPRHPPKQTGKIQ